jgi:enolase
MNLNTSKYNVVIELGNDREKALEILSHLAVPAYENDIIESSQAYEIFSALAKVIPRTGDISESIGEEGCLMQEMYEERFVNPYLDEE